jgi:hypothetical protein
MRQILHALARGNARFSVQAWAGETLAGDGMVDAERLACAVAAKRHCLQQETPMHAATIDPLAFELHFQSLAQPGRTMAFPCDAKGRVDMDALGKRALCNYLYARAFIGREFRFPLVRPVAA